MQVSIIFYTNTKKLLALLYAFTKFRLNYQQIYLTLYIKLFQKPRNILAQLIPLTTLQKLFKFNILAHTIGLIPSENILA